MNAKTLIPGNLTGPQDQEYHDRVMQTVKFANNRVSRLIVANTAAIQIFRNMEVEVNTPAIIQIQHHINNTATLTLGLNPGEIVAVEASQIEHIHQSVRFYKDIMYLERPELAGDFYIRTHELGNLLPTYRKPVALDAMGTVATVSNQCFLETLLGNEMVGEYGNTEMLKISYRGRKSPERVSTYNSIAYKLIKTEDGYQAKLARLGEIADQECIYIRHHYIKNEIQFFAESLEDVVDVLKCAELRSNSKFFIHSYQHRGNPEVMYRVHPIFKF